MPRRSLLLAAALAAAAVTGAAPAAAQSPDCPAGYECGSLTVPLDRAAPGGPTTQVAYALRRHTAGGPAAGTIVPNPGGPGGAVIADAAEWEEALGPEVLATRDLLLVDPRGVGRSDALECGLPEDALLPGRSVGQLVRTCAAALGPERVNAYGSAAVADDVDAVRAALGIEQLDLWGQSYGTYLFTVYARRHPERVRSMVLSGAYAPEFDTWARDRSRAFRSAIRLVCRRSERCRGGRVLRDLATVRRALDRRPLRVRATVLGAPRTLSLDGAALAALSYATYEDARLLGVLPGLARAAARGQAGPLVALARAAAEATPSLSDARAVFSPAATIATTCHDYPAPYDRAAPVAERRAQYDRALRRLRARDFAPFTAAGWTRAVGEGADACLEWPAPAGDGPLDGGALPDVPVLIANGDLDVNTTLESARELQRLFPAATLLRVPNVAHTPEADPTGCALRVYRRFLTTRQTGPTRCLRRIPPVNVGSGGS